MITAKDIKEGRFPVNFETFNRVFSEQYNYFYGQNEEEESVNTDKFDSKIASNPAYRLLARLSYEIRKDFIMSDREAAAFEKTVNILGVKLS